MSKERIEEMAHNLCHWWNGKGCTFGMVGKKAFACRFDCNAFIDAERLYNAGYRKQSEGEWIARDCITESKRGRTIHYSTHKCSVCGKWNGRHKSKFCPNCGAKMKGGEDNA